MCLYGHSLAIGASINPMILQQVAVIGAGTMGRGIAQWFAQQGVRTFLWDKMAETLPVAEEKIHASWEKLAAKGKFTSVQVEEFKECLFITEKFTDIPPNCDLLIEAVVENLEVKEKVFRDCADHFSQQSIFASNTSSLSIEKIAAVLPVSRRELFFGLHFFNPAPVMKLVEIVTTKSSRRELAVELRSWFEQKGKRPVVCSDSPGFIVNRIARSFYGEALRIASSENQESVAEVDRVLKEVGGFAMGPFELMDLIGIDINYAATCSVWQAFDKNPRFEPHPWQKRLVAEGKLGKKSGGGFYG